MSSQAASPTNPTYAIELEQVTKTYISSKGEQLAIHNIHLKIEQGEFIALVGPSGCGKSTLLNMIAGLIPLTEGKIQVLGQPVASPIRQIGYMLQSDYLFPWRTIWENCKLGIELNGKTDPSAQMRIEQLLAEMGLLHVKDRYPHELSGGMRQRVALVRTLALDPPLLLLDEPFSALDYQTKLQMEDLIWDILKRFKKTVVLVTHDLSEAIAVSDRVVVLSRNPGQLKRIVSIPPKMRSQSPFLAREAPEYPELFRLLWEDLQDDTN